MKKLIIDKLPRVIKARKKLEKELEVEITNRGKEIYLDGSPENEHIAEQVIEAIDFGFPISHVLQIKEQGLIFLIINIKEFLVFSGLEHSGKAERSTFLLTQSLSMELKLYFPPS